MSDSRLYIGNLSYETTESDLRTFLADAGVISSVSSMMDRVTGRSRGFAFVDMASADEAQKGGGDVQPEGTEESGSGGEHGPPP